MEHNNSTYRDKVTAGPVYRGCGISSETGLKHKNSSSTYDPWFFDVDCIFTLPMCYSLSV